MLLSETYLLAPVKPCYLPLENSKFCIVFCILMWKLNVTFILCVKSTEELRKTYQDESGCYYHSL